MKDLQLFGPEKWIFFLERTQSWSGEVAKFPEDLFFFGDHLISAGKTVSILVKTFFLISPDFYRKTASI